MTYEGIRKQLADLAAQVPNGYETYDADGKPVIQSKLPSLQWYMWASNLLRSRGREAEKKTLRAQLARSIGTDNGGGVLCQVIAAMAAGPVERSGRRKKEAK